VIKNLQIFNSKTRTFFGNFLGTKKLQCFENSNIRQILENQKIRQFFED